MFRTAFVVLAAMACAQARPGQFPGFQTIQFGLPQSSGQSSSTITKGETVIPGGVSTITQQQSETNGRASNGDTNVGTASTDTQSLNTPQGISSSSNTDVKSVQGSHPAFNSFGDGLALPSIPAIPSFNFGSANGHSNSGIKRQQAVGPHGATSNVVQQQSGTGGQVSNGGFNVGTASTDTQSLNTPQGISSSSNTDVKSVQGSHPAFNSLGGDLALPSIPAIPSFNFGSANGHSNSGIKRQQAVGPHGATSNVVQQQSGTGGQVSNGGFNVGTASTDTQSLNTPQGISSSSNTDAQSVQGSHAAFNSFGGGVGVPRFPSIHGFPGFGSAAGRANSELTESDSVGPDGSRNKVTVLGSSAGGSAQDGGTSVNQASGSTSSTDGVGGSQTQSHLDSTSIQTSGR